MSDTPQYTPVPPQPPAPSQPGAQSGLSDNAAGALAYVTIIPAIIFLIVEPYNKNSYIRFHSWQSIFLGIAFVAIHIVLGIIPLIGWLVLMLLDLGFLVLWIVVILKALKGERFRLPVIGKYAAQQAGA
ncbi:MAG TPA: DUF4870 domain-containing protein [Terracidiphilus sp.]|jgi:uncharacterized membrane protein|nr:DUF4870 domain-containing protein [Terracidiphilus sp.]